MSQLIQFLSQTSTGGSCKKAIAPVVYQSSVDILSGTGATVLPLLVSITSGNIAAFGGQVVNKGCHSLLATINYLNGDDCDECTAPDILSTVPVTVIIPKNSAFPIPDGFLTGITVQTLNSAGVPVDVQYTQEVDFYSAYQPCCGAGVLVP
jgi:hypothetical protein